MKISESLSTLIKTTQKISEQMASVNKITNLLNVNSSFIKNYEASQKIASTLTIQNKFYSGVESIHKVSNVDRINNLASGLVKQHKFYGGGEAIDVIGDFEKNSRLKTSIEALNSVIKSNNSELFIKPTLSLNNSKTISTLRTFQTVSERNLSAHISHRDKLAEKISEVLYSTRDNVVSKKWNSQTFIESSFENFKDYYFDEFLFRHFDEYIRCEKEIEYERSKIEIFKKLNKAAIRKFRKFSLNRRDFFRKINSFHFKNLDDYHSLTLIISVN